jgi:8-oxo-dGTP pyrophosphatase MutT (NUDIX family)
VTPLSVIDRLAAALRTREATLAERDPPFQEAAVAMVLLPRDDDAHLLLLRRAHYAGDPWSGQIGLPGGRSEPGDASLLHTAIREAREETALDLSDARVLGVLDELRPQTPVLPPVIVRPYVLTIRHLPTLVPSEEVDALFWAPLRTLFDPANARDAEVRPRGSPMMVRAIDFEGRIIWGMTERIIRCLQGVLEARAR